MSRSRERRPGWVCGALLALLTPAAAIAHGPPPSEAAVEATYLFRFAGYVEWPDGGLRDHPFVIAVMGDEDVAQELRRLLPGRLIDNHAVEVREITRVSEAEGARILYIGPGHDDFLRALRPRNSEPILVVTEEEQGLDLGGMVNFLTVDKHVRFEISLTAAERAHLRISAALLSVALRVRGGGRQSNELCVPFWLPTESRGGCNERAAQLAPFRKRHGNPGALARNA